MSQIVSSDAIVTSGDNYENRYATMQVTIGELITETIASNGITLTQGFQQTDIIVKPTSISNIQIAVVNVYPNPTENSIKINFQANSYESCIYELFDNNGQKLMQEKIKDNITDIPLTQFVAGIYILKVYSTKSNINQSFVIEKQ